MIILKSKVFAINDKLTNFVNDNNISRDNILSITVHYNSVKEIYTIFYYADSESEEKTRGFWG